MANNSFDHNPIDNEEEEELDAICDECGAEISSGDDVCPSCGEELEDDLDEDEDDDEED